MREVAKTCESTSITCGASRLVSNWTPSSEEKEVIGDSVLKYPNQYISDTRMLGCRDSVQNWTNSSATFGHHILGVVLIKNTNSRVPLILAKYDVYINISCISIILYGESLP